MSETTSKEPVSSSDTVVKWSLLTDNEKELAKIRILGATENGYLQQVQLYIMKYNVLKQANYNLNGLKLIDCKLVNNAHQDNPLHLAAYHGHLLIVKYFIEEDYCDAEHRNYYKNTPLHRAARMGQLDVVKYLINDRRCNPMIKCNWGRTPLHIACRHGHFDLIKYLLDLNVDSNAKDKRYQSTPLDLASAYATVKIVKYMIEIKNCYNPANYKGLNTPLHFAAYRGNLPVVQYLVRSGRFDVNVTGEFNGTPIHSACRGGYIEIVKYLIETGKVDLSCRTEQGLTPLDTAAERGTLDIVQYLVEDVKFVLKLASRRWYTPLHHAARGGKIDTVKYFIEVRNYDPGCKGLKGRTPLHSASLGGRLDVVEYLIQSCGVQPSCLDSERNTPLHSAVKGRHMLVVQYLVTVSNSELDSIDQHGRIPASIAQSGSKLSQFLDKSKWLQHDEFHLTLRNKLNIIKAIQTEVAIAPGIIELKVIGSEERVAGKIINDPPNSRNLMTKLGAIIHKLRSIAELNHVNVVKNIGVCLLPDRILPVLLMERIKFSLKSCIPQSNFLLTLEMRIQIVKDVASGLNYLHNLKPPLIHGHLTADNILLDNQLTAKIGGFEIEQVSEMEYTPPESLGGEVMADSSQDVFSFGHLCLVTLLQKDLKRLKPIQYFNNEGNPCVRLEYERRTEFIEEVKKLILPENQQLISGIIDCLQNNPKHRPGISQFTKKLQLHEDKMDNEYYDKAMERGYIKSALPLLILAGVTGSGKSEFKRLMLGQPVPDYSPSTPLAEAAVRSMSVCNVAVDGTIASAEWVEVGPEEMIQRIRSEMNKGQQTLENTWKEQTFMKINTEVTPIENSLTIQSNNTIPTPDSSERQPKTKSTKDQKEKKQTLLRPDYQHTAKPINMREKIMQASSNSPKGKKLMDVDYIYLLDSGGQPAFREILPHFVQQASAIVLMQKLNEELDFKPEIMYREEGGKVDKGYTSQLTNEQILHQYVQGVQSHDSKVFVIGTHRDKEGDCEGETREQKDEKLLRVFKQALKGKYVLYETGTPDKLIFPLNCISRDLPDTKVAEEFRTMVTKLCMKEDQKFEIPIPWFLLDQALKSHAEKSSDGKECGVLSIEECYEIAQKEDLQLKQDVFNACLRHLSKRNIIFYRPDILPKVVFTSAQIILDKLTELVQLSHSFRTNSDPNPEAEKIFRREGKVYEFRDFGRVDSKLLEEAFPSHYREGLFTSPDLLLLLERMLIAGRLNSGEHFIPSLLPDIPVEEIAEYRATVDHPPPLVIYYPKMWLPVGVMSSLVVYLQNECDWVLAEKNCTPCCMKHNCIEFELLDEPGSIVLVDSIKFLEIHVKPTDELDGYTLQSLLHTIWENVKTGLQAAHKSLHYNPPETEFGFPCSGKCGNKELHYATLVGGNKKWRCSENKTIGGKLDDRQKIWLYDKDRTESLTSDAGGEGECLEITRLRENLTHITRAATAGGCPQHFGNKLVEKDFIPHHTVQQILNTPGLAPGRQASILMDSVFARIELSERKEELFKRFVGIFAEDCAYEDLVHKLCGTAISIKNEMEMQSAKMVQSTLDDGSTTENFPVIRGADIISRRVIKIQPHRPLDFHWKSHGFKINIPARAISNEKEITLCIQASVSGEYWFPDDGVLASGVYWLSLHPPVEKFNKNVTITLQHCASDNDPKLTFVTAKCTQETLPYSFKPISSLPISEYGTASIQMDHFSAIGATASSAKTYAFHSYYISPQLNMFDDHITVTKNIELELQDVKKQYSRWKLGPCTLTNIKDDSVSISIPEIDMVPERTWEKNGWKITPLVTPPTLDRRILESHEKGKSIPYFALKLRLENVLDPKVLEQRIDFTGVDPPTAIQIIREFTSSVIEPRQQRNDGAHLSMDDLHYVRSALQPVTDRWKHIGLALRLDLSQLKKIEAQYRDIDDCLIEMLSLWLKKNYNTERFGEPSWELLSRAVGDPSGGNDSALAETIRR